MAVKTYVDILYDFDALKYFQQITYADCNLMQAN